MKPKNKDTVLHFSASVQKHNGNFGEIGPAKF
jgi:hypothetical protein